MTDRPSDADTAMVVAEWKGWENVEVYSYLGDLSMCVHPKHEEGDMRFEGYGVCDPRDDTDAALELLGWLDAKDLIADVEIDYYWTETADGIKGSCWEVELCENDPEIGMGEVEYVHLPLSGEPFRYAVVALCVKVMGGGE